MSVSETDFEIHLDQSSDSQQINGRVSQLRENWRIFEDGALAERLQSEEIAAHLGGNRRRNHQIRDDFPKALEEQTKEQNEATRKKEEHRHRLKQLEDKDAQVAQKLQLKDLINSDGLPDPPARLIPDSSRRILSTSDMRHRDYEVERDRVFAQRLQKLEAEHSKRLHEKKKPTVPQPKGGEGIFKPTQPVFSTCDGRSNLNTPPLPVLANGDVLPSTYDDSDDVSRVTPDVLSQHLTEDDVLPHVRGGIKYNDDQYLVKLARPAIVTSEPLYANNHPEHYAVSTKYPFATGDDQRSRGAVRKSKNYDSQQNDRIEYDTGTCIQGDALSPEPVSGLLLDAAGLSQKDLAMSKKAEEQLIQERRDAELARRLQEDLSLQSNMDHQSNSEDKAAKEAEDFEYARALQEKEESKLRRAKERSRQRKKQREMLYQQQTPNLNETENRVQISAEEQYLHGNQVQHEILHSRSDSRISKKSQQNSADNLTPSEDSPNIQTSIGIQIPKSAEETLAITRGNQNVSYDDSDSVASANHIVTSTNTHHTNKSISPKEMKPPARKPYMNTGAIDSHQSEFATAHRGRSHSGSATEELAFDDAEEDEVEPRYANVGPKGPLAAQLYYGGNKITNISTSNPISNVSKKDISDEPIPPYMPMQQQTRFCTPSSYAKRNYHTKLW